MGSMRLNTAGHRLNKLEDNSGEHIQVQAYRDIMIERTKSESNKCVSNPPLGKTKP